jgi:hypothetical protein
MFKEIMSCYRSQYIAVCFVYVGPWSLWTETLEEEVGRTGKYTVEICYSNVIYEFCKNLGVVTC